jgi:hypothetical protein
MSDSIRWNPDVECFDANPAATVVLDRAAWERAGAVFVEQDDGDDEVSGLAVGEIAAGDEMVQFGVLDYGEQETFILVPGRDRAAVDTARAVLSALQVAGVVDLTTQLADFSAGDGPSSSHVPLEERVEVLERKFAELAPLTKLQLTPGESLWAGTVGAYPAIGELLFQDAVTGLERSYESHRISGQLRLPNVIENVEDVSSAGRWFSFPSPDEDVPIRYPYLFIKHRELDLARRYQLIFRWKREMEDLGTIASVRGEKDEER